MAPSKYSNKIIYDMLMTIKVILSGREDDRHDLGLVGDVEKNTTFRRQLQKMAWTIFILMVGGNIPIFIFGYRLLASQ